ncbi:MAG TPA: DUF6036 family nucleotidyltransferase [Pyrinomonadaceae bacterium]|nr:DUF6036 family nucleotidyltransferase [Pyrinomonadaceae bacterium]
MRQPLTAESLHVFMKALAAEARTSSRIYLVGGASAVLLGWREATIDVDLKIIPETDEILRSLPRLKEQLHINIELASPDDFIPELPGWQDRSQFIRQEGKLSFHHYDFYAQALAKTERNFEIDRQDVAQLISSGLVVPQRLLELFARIEGELYRFPQLNRSTFRAAVERVIQDAEKKSSSD